MLTKREFDLLFLLAQQQDSLSQRQIAEHLSCSVGTINKLLQKLTEQGCILRQEITEQGQAMLTPYRVKRAIFIAAGFAPRLTPISLNTPTPLIRVNGTRIIDTMLDAVIAAKIPEIVIVRGYLGEQFEQLLHKYPQIQFVDNPNYNDYNNISSAMQVRHLLSNAYVMDADLMLNKPSLIRTYEYQSNLLGIPVQRTDDWCVTTDRSGFVDSVTLGGVSGYQEVGISYWSGEDGMKLANDLEDVYTSPGGKERFWEQTALQYKKDHYQVAVRSCEVGDVVEVDTLNELRALDHAYNF